MKSEDIQSRHWSDVDRQTVRRISAAQAADLPAAQPSADMPPLTESQLAALVRLPDARPPKVAVSVRLDASVLAWLKTKGQGHLTRINLILANLMDAERAAQRRH